MVGGGQGPHRVDRLGGGLALKRGLQEPRGVEVHTEGRDPSQGRGLFRLHTEDTVGAQAKGQLTQVPVAVESDGPAVFVVLGPGDDDDLMPRRAQGLGVVMSALGAAAAGARRGGEAAMLDEEHTHGGQCTGFRADDGRPRGGRSPVN